MAEIEFAVIEIRHTGQALAECVQADDTGVHLAHPHRQGVHLLLQDPLGILDLPLLAQQFGGPVAQLIEWIAMSMPGAQTDADGECRAQDPEHHQGGSRHNHGMPEVKLFYSARFAADKNDIHMDLDSYADTMLKLSLMSSRTIDTAPRQYR